MLFNLSHKQLVHIVKGVSPDYSAFEIPLVKQSGSYSDSRGWSWSYEGLNRLSDEQLVELYNTCEVSWISKEASEESIREELLKIIEI